MRGEDALEKQRKWVEKEGDWKCLIHHTTDPRFRAEVEEVVRSGDPALAVIALEGLAPCPTRGKK